MTHVQKLFSRLCLVLGALVFGAVLVSCDGGGSSKEDLSPEEASEQISSSIDGLSESMRTLEGGDFSTRFKAFLDLQNGEAGSEEWAEQLVEGLESVFRTTDDRFDFDGSTGEYAWNAAQEQWDKESPSDNIVLRFPATQDASNNNATFTVEGYSDTQHVVDGETVYLPTNGSASLTVEDTEVFSVRLSDASYETEEGLEVPVPQSFGLEIFTAPHTHSFALNNNSEVDFDFSFELSNGDQLVAGLSVNVLLATANYDEMESADVEEVSGDLNIGSDIAVPYTIQVGELAALDDPSEQEINDRIDAPVEYKGQRIATLRYDKASEKVEVVYSDGSVDPASKFLEDFADEMKTIWSDYMEDDAEFDLDAAREGMSTLIR